MLIFRVINECERRIMTKFGLYFCAILIIFLGGCSQNASTPFSTNGMLSSSSAKFEGDVSDPGSIAFFKNNVGISFGKGESNMAKHLQETIKEMGLIPEVKVSVHPSTLKATIKKWHEEGKSVPDNMFSLFIGQKTKITKKK